MKQEILSRQLLAPARDKNLGIAVVSKDWYNEECSKQLSDHNTYTRIKNGHISHHIQRVRTEIELLLRRVAEVGTVDWKKDVLIKHLGHKVFDDNIVAIPEFKGLPKVHKSPRTLRPIVPSHSWINSTVSKVADYLLQPMLELYP